VAVVESEIDGQSGASAEISRADVRLVTAELRREAVKNLPSGKYSIMTSETVIAQGGAFAVDCNEENCVIALGGKIGADYIVRGTISKLETKFTLTVEMYETENGNLVALSDPVRAESVMELVEKAAAACADMYKTFAESQNPMPKPPATPAAEQPTPPPPVAQKPDSPLQQLQKMGIDISVGAGGLISGEHGGGAEWQTGERVKMPLSGSGAYIFADAAYAELSVAYRAGSGKWESQNTVTPQGAPDMARSYINIGAFAKYPFDCYRRAKLFPLLGIDYAAAIAGKIKYPNGGGEYTFDGANGLPDIGSLSSVWFKFGGGVDFGLGKKIYLRAELLYGMRAANAFEEYCAEEAETQSGVTAKDGQGVDFRIGIGAKF
jgi:hypothetical protein